MVRKRILVPLLTAAALILDAAVSFSIHECTIPSGTGGGDDGSTAGGPCTGSCSRDPPAGFCLPISRREMRAMHFFLGVLVAKACLVILDRFADGDEGQASGAAKKKGKN